MECIYCGAGLYVKDTRENGGTVFRRRKCPECGCELYSFEEFCDYEEWLRVKREYAAELRREGDTSGAIIVERRK